MCRWNCSIKTCSTNSAVALRQKRMANLSYPQGRRCIIAGWRCVVPRTQSFRQQPPPPFFSAQNLPTGFRSAKYSVTPTMICSSADAPNRAQLHWHCWAPAQVSFERREKVSGTRILAVEVRNAGCCGDAMATFARRNEKCGCVCGCFRPPGFDLFQHVATKPQKNIIRVICWELMLF